MRSAQARLNFGRVPPPGPGPSLYCGKHSPLFEILGKIVKQWPMGAHFESGKRHFRPRPSCQLGEHVGSAIRGVESHLVSAGERERPPRPLASHQRSHVFRPPLFHSLASFHTHQTCQCGRLAAINLFDVTSCRGF